MSFLIHNEAFLPNQKLSYEISDFFDHQINNSTIHKHIIVVPTRKIVQNIKKYVAQQYSIIHHKATNNLYIYNLEDFFKQICNWLDIIKDKRIISEGIQLMLIEQAINQSNLNYYRFQDNYLKLDVARKISSVINGLRMDGVGFESDYNDFIVFDTRKAEDIDIIHRSYANLLGSSLLDIPSLMEHLLFYLLQDKSVEHLSNILINKHNIETISLFGFSDFRQLEYKILSTFRNLSIPFIINLDYSEFAGPLFGNFQKIVKFFIENQFKLYNNEQLYLDDERLANKLSYHLFDEKKGKKSSSLTENLTIIECQNIVDEVQYITKMVKYFNIIQKIPLSQIAIVARNPDEYASLFFNSFKSEKIPVNITHRKNIKQSVIVRNILLILKIIEGNFSFEHLKLLFESKFVTIDEIDKGNFLEVVRILKLKNNKLSFDNDFIKNRAISFLNYLNTVLNTETDKYTRKDSEKLKEKLERFLSDIIIIQSNFNSFEKKIEISKLKLIYHKILREFGIVKSLVSQIEQIQANKNIYTLDQYNDLLEAIEAENNALDVFANLIEKLAETLPILKVDTITISELLDRLEIACVNEKYQIREKENFGVTVTSIDQIRMVPFKIKVLCGAIDGTIPLTYQVEKFLGKELLESKYEHYRAEKVLFYQFLEDASWKKFHSQKFITYPKMNNNTIKTISPLLDSLIRNTNIKEKGKFINSTDENDLLPINHVIISNAELFKFLHNYKINYSQISDSREIESKLSELSNFVQNQFLEKNVGNIVKLNDWHQNNLINKHYTIGDFENYSQCPYFYYLKRILKVEQTKEAETKLEPIEIGNIYHKILFEFYSQLQSKNTSKQKELNPVELNPIEKSKYREMMLEITRRELSNPLYDHPFVKLHTNKLLSNQSSINPLLNWLDNEINEQLNNSMRPSLFEYPISIDVSLEPETKQKITYTIKIDRIDIDINSVNPIEFSVVDYKIRSNKVGDKEILDLKSFQIPIYMVCTKEHFKSKGLSFVPISGKYYNLLDFQKNQRLVLDSKSSKHPIDIDEVLAKSISKTFEIKNNLTNGLFPITTEEQNCRYCNMEPICRKKTVYQ